MLTSIIYPSILLTGSKVTESAQWFRAGMFGRYEDSISDLTIIPEDNVTISVSTCSTETPLYQKLYIEGAYSCPVFYLPEVDILYCERGRCDMGGYFPAAYPKTHQ